MEIAGIDLSISQAVIAMWIGIAVVFGLFMLIVSRGVSPVPSKLQSIAEVLLEFVRDMVNEFIGKEEGKKYFSFVGTVFFFILACNLVGLIPGSYTITSQLVVTGVFATGIFLMTLVIGFAKHGAHFLSILVPPGVPKIMIPVMVPIEIISMIARPISLSVRLFANMTAGHTLLKVFAGFIVTMGIAGIVPFAFVVALTGLEFLIAFLQAYVFTILTCIYINDALHLH